MECNLCQANTNVFIFCVLIISLLSFEKHLNMNGGVEEIIVGGILRVDVEFYLL